MLPSTIAQDTAESAGRQGYCTARLTTAVRGLSTPFEVTAVSAKYQ